MEIHGCSLLAAYDLGAPAKLLQAIYDNEAKDLDPIHMADRTTKLVEEQHVDITLRNWTEFLGQHKYVLLLWIRDEERSDDRVQVLRELRQVLHERRSRSWRECSD